MLTYGHNFHTYAFSDIECGRPEVPRHGFLLEGVEYTYPNTVTFACEDGYVLTGHSIIRCESNGLWSEASPKCLPIGKTGLILSLRPANERQRYFVTRHSLGGRKRIISPVRVCPSIE